jgi:predicted sulfurtransferase
MVIRKPISVISRHLGTHSRAEFIELAKNPEIVVIDVRNNSEVAGGTIPAANWMNLPIHQFVETLEEFDDVEGITEKNFELVYGMKKPAIDQHVRTKIKLLNNNCVVFSRYV